MAKQGTTLQNYNNELVKCTFLAPLLLASAGCAAAVPQALPSTATACLCSAMGAVCVPCCWPCWFSIRRAAHLHTWSRWQASAICVRSVRR